MGRLNGKVAVVTGGNAGIGEAIAVTFAREGASVVMTGRRKEELDRVARAIERDNGRAIGVAGSVTDDEHVQSVVRRGIEAFGGLHILVNNAGIGDFGKRIHEIDDATWHRVLDVNLTGVFRMTRAAVPEFLKRGGGSIVNISSVASLVGIPLLPAYAASKGALDALTRAMAIDYALDKIRCNVINPGLIATPMAAPLLADEQRAALVLADYPMRRPGRPEDVAMMAVYLASDESNWVTGATFPIDGGRTVR